MPAQRLIVVLWSCGPDRPGGAVLAAAPFVYALTARAMEIEVQMHFTSSAVRWLVAGVADDAFTDQGRTKTVRDFIVEAQRAGVALYACGMALAEHRHANEPLLDGVKMAGAATVIGASVEDGVRTLVF
jgi:predicted peroxiredoxin